MIEKIKDIFYSISDNYDTIIAVFLYILVVVLALGLVFGVLAFDGWILMFVYNALAGVFGWPIFSFWFWFCVPLVLGVLRKGINVNVKKEKDD